MSNATKRRQPRRSQIAKWGNSAAIRLPADAIKQVGLKVGDDISLRVDGDKLVIGPAESVPAEIDSEALLEALAQVGPEDVPPLIRTGKPRGDEIW